MLVVVLALQLAPHQLNNIISNMDIIEVIESYRPMAMAGNMGNEEFKMLYNIVCEYFSDAAESLGEIEKLMSEHEAKTGDAGIRSFNHRLCEIIYDRANAIADENENSNDSAKLSSTRIELRKAREAINFIQHNHIKTYEDAISFKQNYGGVVSVDKSLDELLGIEWEYKEGLII